ncbi:MAG: ferritin-like domain-containing protein [Alphaproteobacteria bacterium]|nr:ferritin-like domain-containing protein [Alphaproteobacteria bacterium]
MADRERLAQWLRDAHGMEQQAETMLTAQASRLENYPELRRRIEQHIKETQGQRERLETCLDKLDTSSSTMKDLAGRFAALLQGIGGMFAGDEVVKGAMAGYVFENIEISSYIVLLAAAEEAGEAHVAQVCRENLAEEHAMADWLRDHLPSVTQTFLRREERGETAKR